MTPGPRDRQQVEEQRCLARAAVTGHHRLAEARRQPPLAELLVEERPGCDGGQHLAATTTRALQQLKAERPGAARWPSPAWVAAGAAARRAQG